VVSYSNASTVRTFERASYKVRGGFAASDKSLRFAGVAVARNDPVFHGATNSITFRVLAVVESTQGQLRVYDNAIGVQHLLRAFDLRAHFANCRPYAVATDHYGNFVITDTARHSVYVISKSGALVREFGRQGSGDGEFNEPRGVALTSGGDIVVIDSLNSRVQIFDTNGAFLTAFGRLGAGDGEFNEPTGVAVDSAGTIVVADPRNRRIQMFRRSGAFVRAFTHASFVAPRDVAVVINGDMMVIDGEANALFVVGVPAKPGALYASPASNAVHNDVRCQIANWYTLQEIDRDDVASRRLRPCKRCG
jgi:DNA-binding beta-propeller fold protein YncE